MSETARFSFYIPVQFQFVSMSGAALPGNQIPPELLNATFNMAFPMFSPFFGTGTTPNQNFEDLLDRMFRQHQPRGPPPASKHIFEREIKEEVVKENLEQDCSVCCDGFEVGSSRCTLPCTHGFHKDCITTWLKQANTCPVCRWELETDDPEYEKERIERMKNRRPPPSGSPSNLNEHIQVIPNSTQETQDGDNMEVDPPSTQNQTEKNVATQPSHPLCEMSNLLREECYLIQPESHVTLSCGHNFHGECLVESLKIREEIPPTSTTIPEGIKIVCPSCKKCVHTVKHLEVD
jgi:hypothetical protein